jgi:glycosyltransferase involved in cell wall biosynthesis
MPEHCPRRVVIDARYLAADFSGIGTYSQCLLEHMARLDAETEYHVLVHAGFRRALDVGPNFHLHPIDAAPLSWATLATLERRVQALRPDLFHVHCPVVPPRHRGLMIVTVHDLQPLIMPEWTGRRPWPLPWLYRRFYRWAYGVAFDRATRLLADSQATRRAIMERFPQHADKTIVIPNGFSPPPPVAESEDEALWTSLRDRHAIPRRFALYVGSTRPNKNLPGMLRAFARMRRQAPDCADAGFVLVLTPDRFMRDVHRAIAAEGLAGHVRILSRIGVNERTVLLRHAAAFFFVTRLEGFGFPILEAQDAGTPVLASTADAAPEVAGQGALFASPDDVEGQAAAMARILQDKALRDQLIASGHANCARFKWEDAARLTLDAYRETMAVKSLSSSGGP